MSICVGDRLVGRAVSAIVNNIPVSFERRRYGGSTFTWAHAYVGDRWLSLGDPWPVVRPKTSEILAALDLHLASVKAAQPEKSRILLTLRDAHTGIEHNRDIGSTSEFNLGSTAYQERFIQAWIRERGNQQHASQLELVRWEYLTPAQWKHFYDSRPTGAPPTPSPSVTT